MSICFDKFILHSTVACRFYHYVEEELLIQADFCICNTITNYKLYPCIYDISNTVNFRLKNGV